MWILDHSGTGVDVEDQLGICCNNQVRKTDGILDLGVAVELER